MPSRLDRIRSICLSVQEAAERETWGHPTFRVRGKIFASRGEVDELIRSSYLLVPPRRLAGEVT